MKIQLCSNLSRSHSRNQHKVGRDSPQRQPREHLSQFILTKSPEASLSAVFWAWLRLLHRALLVWKLIFIQFKWWSRNYRDPCLEWFLLQFSILEFSHQAGAKLLQSLIDLFVNFTICIADNCTDSLYHLAYQWKKFQIGPNLCIKQSADLD